MKKNLPTLLIALTLLLSACDAAPGATPTEAALPINTTPALAPGTTPLPTASPTATWSSWWRVRPARTTPLPTASPTATANVAVTPTPESVIVTAVNGNVFIRRGPDLAFDPLAVLMDGQSAEALARDVLTGWLQIRVPGRPDVSGWISIQTRFVIVRGEVADLPEVVPTEWPIPASLRNCTHHQMIARPGDILIPPVENFPNNEVQINPGVYTIYDLETAGEPEVMEVEVKEGSYIEIQLDGNGDKRKCPIT